MPKAPHAPPAGREAGVGEVVADAWEVLGPAHAAAGGWPVYPVRCTKCHAGTDALTVWQMRARKYGCFRCRFARTWEFVRPAARAAWQRLALRRAAAPPLPHKYKLGPLGVLEVTAHVAPARGQNLYLVRCKCRTVHTWTDKQVERYRYTGCPACRREFDALMRRLGVDD